MSRGFLIRVIICRQGSRRALLRARLALFFLFLGVYTSVEPKANVFDGDLAHYVPECGACMYLIVEKSNYHLSRLKLTREL